MMDTMQFISSSETKEKGRTEYYKMLNRVKDGELIQVRRGVYATSEQISGNMIDIESIVPGGILCLWSAWMYALKSSTIIWSVRNETSAN